jgi:hypothetical protein
VYLLSKANGLDFQVDIVGFLGFISARFLAKQILDGPLKKT